MNKEFLSDTYKLNNRIKRLYEKLDLLNSQKTAIKSVDTEKERVFESKRNNYNLEKILDQEKYYKEILEKELSTLKERQDIIKEKIKTINDWEIEEVMLYRYIHFFPWETIRCSCSLSKSDMFRKHDEGLKIILS